MLEEHHSCLPCKVVKVKDRALEVTPIGDPLTVRKVPITKAKKLESHVPSTLEPLLMDQISRELPAQAAHHRRKALPPAKPVEEVLRHVQKRPRPEPEVEEPLDMS
eukprot:Blabericola_migrator_1__9417@NODE_5095_length_876_cov_6_126082_g3230_i0_p1_GENE_NODE_5095_length_876_cov_6_126082_g3230_i0NODE_5095_length_876_cov_6_126082_g3230_i0_p1_ORF_typecomplete_len106_score22_17_NODE_5095_length_876_cov_6_126082_g3230_i037354